MEKYKLVNYDTLGNKNDGWEVNSAHFCGIEIELPKDFTDKQLKQSLYRSGFATRGILNAKLDIQGESEHCLYINLNGTRYNGKPFCELRRIKMD